MLALLGLDLNDSLLWVVTKVLAKALAVLVGIVALMTGIDTAAQWWKGKHDDPKG